METCLRVCVQRNSRSQEHVNLCYSSDEAIPHRLHIITSTRQLCSCVPNSPSSTNPFQKASILMNQDSPHSTPNSSISILIPTPLRREPYRAQIPCALCIYLSVNAPSTKSRGVRFPSSNGLINLIIINSRGCDFEKWATRRWRSRSGCAG